MNDGMLGRVPIALRKYMLDDIERDRAMELIEEVQRRLMKGKTHRFARYLHARDAIARVSDQVKTVCVAGAGHGWAELAIALEFPDIEFTLTDIIAAPGYPNYHQAMDFCWRNDVRNMRFSIWNVLQSTKNRFDLVSSTEMLEHIPDPVRAVKNMRQAATKFVYCLVPFGEDAINNDGRRRISSWEKAEHFVVGFDSKTLKSLFGEPELLAGTYWNDAWMKIRVRLKEMSDQEIDGEFFALRDQALADLRDREPVTISGDGWGIKILARADAVVPKSPIMSPPLSNFLKPAPAIPAL